MNECERDNGQSARNDGQASERPMVDCTSSRRLHTSTEAQSNRYDALWLWRNATTVLGLSGNCRRSRILDKVLAKVDVSPDGCWIWQGSHSGNGRGGGYSRMALDGATVAVHRVVYTLFNGYIPGKKQIDHTCRNRLCVNPNHLEMVTPRQNQRRKKNPPPDPRQTDLEEYIDELRTEK